MIIGVRALADPVYQKRVWVDLERPTPTFEDSLDITIGEIGDLYLDLGVTDQIGIFLEDQREAQTMSKFWQVLDRVIDSLPENATDEVCINTPFWTELVSAAREAYQVLTKGQCPDNMFEDILSGWPQV